MNEVENVKGTPATRGERVRGDTKSAAAIGTCRSIPPVSQKSYAPSQLEVSSGLIANGKEWKTSGIHPSWAAKQLGKRKTATIIPSLQGGDPLPAAKKIKFED